LPVSWQDNFFLSDFLASDIFALADTFMPLTEKLKPCVELKVKFTSEKL
jgi:hypothetical protein